MCDGLSRHERPWTGTAPHELSVKFRKRNALPTTDTELKLIAIAANIGDSRTPNGGYKTPAAIGTPSAL